MPLTAKIYGPTKIIGSMDLIKVLERGQRRRDIIIGIWLHFYGLNSYLQSMIVE